MLAFYLLKRAPQPDGAPPVGTLARQNRVFCRNERAALRLELNGTAHRIALVPVAAILAAGLRLRFMDLPADRDGRSVRVDEPLMRLPRLD